MAFWSHVHGKIRYPLTNDYLFRVLLQRRRNVLESIICSVLGVKVEDIRPVSIRNPIIPGALIDEKEYILDLNVILHGSVSVNIEMQVINYKDWPERSLQYLCRNFDSLNKGDDYLKSMTAIHIGILSFNLFSDSSDFFESYRLIGENSHRVYTDKFQLYTMCLPNVENASEKDIAFHRDVWGKYFKAKTWEELHTMAVAYPIIDEAAEEVYQCIQDEKIRARIEARQDYERRQRTLLRQLASKEEELASKDEQLASKEKELASKDEELASKDKQLEDKDLLIAELKKQIDTLKK
jgi:predicted transposase/invertase (TIGR01784 family)